MTITTYASWLLRLLLDPPALPAFAGRDGAPALDWDVLLQVGRANAVLVRAAERLAALGIGGPERFVAAVAGERQRIRSTLALMEHVSRTCRAHGIAFLFPKAFQDYPDFGDDVDLLVLPRSIRVDDRVIAGLPATPVHRDLGERIAGTTTYHIAGCPSPLDVQHGRLGIVGEHDAFPEALIRHARPIDVDGMQFAEPRPEDQLVLQGIQRVPGRLRIALCDIVFTVSTLRRPTLDWDYVLATARRHGALPGLGCYLSYVEQIHQDAFGASLLPRAVSRSLTSHAWGRIEYRDGGYRFSLVRVNTRLCWRQLRQRIAEGDWEGAARVCLTPVVAAARAARRLTRRAAPAAPRGSDHEWTEPLAEVGRTE